MVRLRSPNYPSVSIENAIEMTGKIYSQERSYPVERAVAAQHLGYSGVTGHSGKILASLLQYGLLEKVAKNQVRVSDTAVEILHPDDPTQKAEALHRSAFYPKLFNELRDRFPEGVPSEANLRSYLVKQGFSDRAISPAIKSYLHTCEYVQLSVPSGGQFSAAGSDVKLISYQQVDGIESRQPLKPGPRKPSDTSFQWPEDITLNDIKSEIAGGLVRINALLDAKGLDKLERKIKAFRELIADDEEEGGEEITRN